MTYPERMLSAVYLQFMCTLVGTGFMNYFTQITCLCCPVTTINNLNVHCWGLLLCDLHPHARYWSETEWETEEVVEGARVYRGQWEEGKRNKWELPGGTIFKGPMFVQDQLVFIVGLWTRYESMLMNYSFAPALWGSQSKTNCAYPGLFQQMSEL